MMRFNAEEENLICIYNDGGRASRTEVIDALTAASPYMDMAMLELAGRTRRKLEKLSNEEYAVFKFCPADPI